ncbi:uncharacterized protein LOC130738037 isoform X3 [Lotus japonicus]|uniref:uncharacterized protein LOC130738037 isoform X3 n=1 Tax=Lotus japonicus TaxID=34305 RepID=UPI00258A97EA|nr:uncharacterized protein LOC130738037 isoform X3 [Lotus japonicus]
MKTEQPLHHRNKGVSSSLSAKPAAYVILLLLTYSLGYFSHSSPTSFPPPSQPASSATLRISTNSPELDQFRITTRCADPLSPKVVRRTIINRLFNGTSPFHGFPPAHAAGKLSRSKKVKGWGSNGAVFENLIRRVRPETIVEVGTFLGASSLHMAELTRRFGLKTQILCIDDFRGWAGFRDRFNTTPMVNGDVFLYYQFLQNAVTRNLTESVLPVPFSSGSGLIWLCELGVFADLVEIDAGHDFLSAWSDINRGYRILRPGGVIFGHDYFTAADNRGVRRALDLFARIHSLKAHASRHSFRYIYPTINY